MNCISLHQPWSTLWSLGKKQNETRHWSFPKHLLGQVVFIHAAKFRSPDLPDILAAEHFAEALAGVSLPFGALVGTVKLIGDVPASSLEVSDAEDAFGDYSTGRRIWLGAEHKVITPIPCRGYQQFWKQEILCLEAGDTMNNAERSRQTKSIADIVAELHKMIADGWEYSDAHCLLCEVYKIPFKVLEDAYDKTEAQTL